MYSDLGDFTSLKEKLLNAFKMKVADQHGSVLVLLGLMH